MEMAEDYQERSRKLVRRFLQTAVLVDDQAYMDPEQGNEPKGEVVSPSRIQKVSGQNDRGQVGRRSLKSLNADSVIDSFSTLGVICGVILHKDSALEAMRKAAKDSALKTMRKADIVILDWLLRDGKPQYTLELLRNLLTGGSDQNSLRLVAIYTGEADLKEICEKICGILTEAGLDPKPNEDEPKISYRDGRVVIYAKSNVAEEELPKELVNDFTEMTSGLLPRIALTSLAAVREGEHKVLDRFSAELDPAFLAHRACLPSPGDAERQIVNHIAEELRGLMDNAVSETSSQDADAVEHWIKGKAEKFKFGNKELSTEKTITLANQGLQKSCLKDKDFKLLSAGFSGSDAADLDEQLAWIMIFRTVYNSPSPTLWLGSVVTELPNEEERHLICMRPRCDCMRLEKKTSFFFLRLVNPGTAKKPLVGLEKINEQIVVKLDNGFQRLDIEFDSSGWLCREFDPSSESEAVTAIKQDGHFNFTDSSGKKQYKWRGEIKAEYAQRIAQNFAARLSRVAVDESEWLRRIAKK